MKTTLSPRRRHMNWHFVHSENTARRCKPGWVEPGVVRIEESNAVCCEDRKAFAEGEFDEVTLQPKEPTDDQV